MTIKAECSDVTDRPLVTSSRVRGSRRSILSDDAFFRTETTNHDALKSLKEELSKALRHPDMEATVDQLREFEPRFLRLAHHSLNRAESSWKPGPTSVTFLCRPQISAAPFQCSG